jgi:serine/threonine protein kinase
MQMLEDDIQRHTTLQYRAPEMIDVYQKKPINEKADIWAMGVLLYKLCFYTTPFEEQGQLAILNARFTIPTSPTFSNGLCQLIISMLQEDQNRRPNIYQVMEAICQLRGLECPLTDIYTEETIVLPHSSQANGYKGSASPPVPKAEMNGPSIFEKMPGLQSAMPDIKPMRRGRPTKPESTPSSSSAYSNNTNNSNNSNNNNNIPSPSSSSKRESSPPPLPSHSVPLSAKESPSPPKASPQPPPAPASTPNNANHKTTQSTSSTESYDPFDISNFKSKYRRPVPPKKEQDEKTDSNASFGFQNNFTTADSAPSKVETTPIKVQTTCQPQVATKVKTGNTQEDEDKENSVKLNKNVSSSIEARFQAIKNAGQQPPKKSKPAPPPKPARFRSAKTTEPSIDDFENKFPSLEELDRNL